MLPLLFILLLVFMLLALALLAAGVLYQSIGSWRDARLYTRSGRWVPLGEGARRYLREAGSGEPTVLFESGIGATNLNWRRIQDAVASLARTVSYDRGGLGWSSPCRTARTPANIAVELHQMLARGGFEPPYILVGHSFGGLVMRRYALSYPDEVAGLVLVDPMRCEEWPPLDDAKQHEISRSGKLVRVAAPMAHCGLVRLAAASLFRRSGKLSGRLADMGGEDGRRMLARIQTEIGKMPREVWPAIAAHWSRPAFYKGLRKHIESISDTVTEMDAAGPIRQIPVVVLTPANAAPLDEEGLQRIGDCTRQVIAPASGHWIHLDQPELVIDSIVAMVKAARNAELPAQDPLACAIK
jgi:pimeloyl-ACP methyl ester carboxylesterase